VHPKKKKAASSGTLPPHKLVLAPMVGGSELAFRVLCRHYHPLPYPPLLL